ncbi:RTC4-like domain-containing protein [Paraphoma chrysanthemicola]|uniref:Restriction of telomere capping protein 4 n=1 Tax=Paraphoma chrysanthemicola TaxID=798071 RepID=A0A8K0VXT1_9PLEO|nr:RTC4-like domain-containing protein [Paraphoma chrysanthemicola]
MPPLTKSAAPLLRRVGNRPHARDDDHEELQRKRPSSDDELNEPHRKRFRSPISKNVQGNSDINAEPQSSDEEIHVPPPRTARAPLPSIPGSQDDTELKVPQRKSARSQGNLEDVKAGIAGKTAKSRVKKAREEDKENASSGIPQSSSTSTESNVWGFGLEHTSQRSATGSTTTRVQFGKKPTGNIHAPPPRKFGKPPLPRVPKQYAKNRNQAEKRKEAREEEEDEDIPMLDEPTSSKEQSDQELRKDIRDPTDKELRKAPRPKKPKILHNQIGDWQQDQALDSSQPDSSAPLEALENLDDYMKKLPQDEEEGSTCHICKAAVSKEEYWNFWNDKGNTVRNQNAFCRAHRTKSAWDEYRSEGYPDIDWTALPRRIQKHRMELFKILKNDRPSEYRDRYEPIALTGKAAAVPSRRKDLPEHIQEELQSYALDDQSTYPGYYGPHGRRVITEHVMKVLKNEIKNCSDAVVQGSGPATFVQAVLVPETAILLIMEDCRVDREDAEEIREKTYDMGMLLNEEIEDQIEANYPSDEENEYFAR